MAAIRKRNKSWRVQIRRRGHPSQFKAFDTRADAEAWARQIESEMDRGAFVSRAEAEKTLVADLLDQYKKEITPGKRSSRVEEYTLERLRIAFGCLPIARLEDFRFHDLRHEATSRFFERGLNIMQVAAITGHKTLQMLKRYTHLRAEELVSLLG